MVLRSKILDQYLTTVQVSNESNHELRTSLKPLTKTTQPEKNIKKLFLNVGSGELKRQLNPEWPSKRQEKLRSQPSEIK